MILIQCSHIWKKNKEVYLQGPAMTGLNRGSEVSVTKGSDQCVTLIITIVSALVNPVRCADFGDIFSRPAPVSRHFFLPF